MMKMIMRNRIKKIKMKMMKKMDMKMSLKLRKMILRKIKTIMMMNDHNITQQLFIFLYCKMFYLKYSSHPFKRWQTLNKILVVQNLISKFKPTVFPIFWWENFSLWTTSNQLQLQVNEHFYNWTVLYFSWLGKHMLFCYIQLSCSLDQQGVSGAWSPRNHWPGSKPASHSVCHRFPTLSKNNLLTRNE